MTHDPPVPDHAFRRNSVVVTRRRMTRHACARARRAGIGKRDGEG